MSENQEADAQTLKAKLDSMLSTDEENTLVCPVCLNEFAYIKNRENTPQIIQSCLHSVCSKCINKLKRTVGTACPVCRKHFSQYTVTPDDENALICLEAIQIEKINSANRKKDYLEVHYLYKQMATEQNIHGNILTEYPEVFEISVKDSHDVSNYFKQQNKRCTSWLCRKAVAILDRMMAERNALKTNIKTMRENIHLILQRSQPTSTSEYLHQQP